MDQPDWDTWRSQFPGLQERTYLNTVSLGQLSNRSRAAVNRFLDLWAEFGASAWYIHWLEEVDRLRCEFAQVIGASSESQTDTAISATSRGLGISLHASGTGHCIDANWQ